LGVIQQTVNAWISDIRGRRRAGREIIIIRLNRLPCPPSFWRGWSQEQIAEVVGISRGRLSQIVNNTNFGEINTLLSRGRDMDYIASHYHMDLALARPPRLRRSRPACLALQSIAGRWRTGPKAKYEFITLSEKEEDNVPRIKGY